jgi:hypothetical protein
MKMSKRIIVFPEELELIQQKLQHIETLLKNKQPENTDAILTSEQVMSLLKVSRRCLQNWRDEGLIEYIAVRGKFFYRMSSIEKMFSEHTQKAEG